MGSKKSFSIVLIALLVTVTACMPNKVPNTPPTLRTTQSVSVPQVSTPTPPIYGDSRWAKVSESAKKEGSVTIYSFGWVGDIGLAVSKDIKAKFGIDANIITGRGAEFLERIKTEARIGQRVGDLTEGSTLHLLNMKGQGLLSKLSSLPSLNDLELFTMGPNAVDPEGIVIIYSILYYTAFSNTKLVNFTDEPKRFRNLLDIQWRGKLGIEDPNIGGGPYTMYVPLLENGYLDLEFVRRLGSQDLRIYSSSRDLGRALASGEIHIAASGASRFYSTLVTEGAPVKPLVMEEGTTLTGNAVAAIKNSPHANATKLIVDWVMSRSGQDVIARTQRTPSVRKDVLDYAPAPLRITPYKWVISTGEMEAKSVQMQVDRAFPKLWASR